MYKKYLFIIIQGKPSKKYSSRDTIPVRNRNRTRRRHSARKKKYETEKKRIEALVGS
jgi:hypothetical protein